tara:strand:- start:339 stop:548 length:210 start_codon:yes stop_codon:yes gene_type:complete
MRRLIDSLVFLNSVVLLLLGGFGIFAYLYVSNPANQDKAKAYLTEQLLNSVPVPEIPEIPLSTKTDLPF